jgi:tyrosine-protein kinase Etk/Wzc
MNAPHPLQNDLRAAPASAPVEESEGINLLEYWDIVYDNKWFVGALLVLGLGLSGTYAAFAPPVFEANTMIQVEDNMGGGKSLLGEAASLFDVKTATTAEIEILRSRRIVGAAVDTTRHYIEARPRYLPIVGRMLARRASGLSDPGFLGLAGYVHGTESVAVPQFDVPQELEGTPFTLTAKGGGGYELNHPELEKPLTGMVGKLLDVRTPLGTVQLMVSALNAKPGADFSLIRQSRLGAIIELQTRLRLIEKGRQSGMIDASLQGTNAEQITLILNEIGRQYVRQNIERKSAEAEKTLAFLAVQLPQFKTQLSTSEEQYNRYRNQEGTVALDKEAELILSQTVELQAKLLEAQQKRREFSSRFTELHPTVQTLDQQIAAWTNEINKLNARVRTLPKIQQDTLRLERDVKVNQELYQQLRNNAVQLQLVREGKIGNVRIIDEATEPEKPVGPARIGIVAVGGVLGLLAGMLLALARNAFFRGARDAQEIEAATGLSVYSTIPLSSHQELIAQKAASKRPGLHLLAQSHPDDPAIESLRSLRTALQFAMLDAQSNRVIITGATPAVGKSFVSANFAALLAAGGKRVLLVDADVRKGHLNQYFGVPRAGGLSELVTGSIGVSHAIRKDLIPNLDLITTGILPPNPAELMMSPALPVLLDRLSPDYDLIIIDTAPVLVAADTSAVSAYGGTVLLVARANQTQMGELHESCKRLAHAGKSVTGVLLNALDTSRRHYGSYSYRYGGYRYTQYSYQADKR